MVKIARATAITVGIIGIIGSFYIEKIQGEIPCKLCLIIRYSIILFTIAAILSTLYLPVIFAGLISLIPGILSDINLIISENSTNHTGFCGEQQGVQQVCSTPEFLGIKTSVWGLVILSILFAIAIKMSAHAYREIGKKN